MFVQNRRVTVPDTINIAAGAGMIHAPSDAVANLKAQMGNAAFRQNLAQDPQTTLNGVGINVDKATADSIKNQLAGTPGISPNAIITVTAIA